MERHQRVVAQWAMRIALLLCVAGAIVMDAQVEGSENNIREGRHLYIKYGCHQCHGYEGQGGLISGPRIAPPALPYEAFAEIVRRPYGVMPAYSPNVMSDEILKGIHDYVRSIE